MNNNTNPIQRDTISLTLDGVQIHLSPKILHHTAQWGEITSLAYRVANEVKAHRDDMLVTHVPISHLWLDGTLGHYLIEWTPLGWVNLIRDPGAKAATIDVEVAIGAVLVVLAGLAKKRGS